MALLFQRELTQPVDIDKVIRMLIVHDLVEMYAGDVPVFETGERRSAKQAAEEAAMARIVVELGAGTGNDVRTLWYEFEHRATPEAEFAHSMDKIEAQIQHNAADIDTWLPAEKARVFTLESTCRDPFVVAFLDVVRSEAIDKMVNAGVDVSALQRDVVARRIP